jgi:hypothetical protein
MECITQTIIILFLILKRHKKSVLLKRGYNNISPEAFKILAKFDFRINRKVEAQIYHVTDNRKEKGKKLKERVIWERNCKSLMFPST